MKILMLFLVLVFTACNSKRTTQLMYRNYIASWSPDGKQLLFYSDRNGNWDVFLINADGTNLRQITSSTFNEREPNWHPEENSFAFSSDSLGEPQIFLHSVNSRTIKKLTDSPGAHTSPCFSRDHKYLAYLTEENKEWKLLVMDMMDSTFSIVYRGSIYPGRPTWVAEDNVMYSVAVGGKETLHVADIDGTINKTYQPGFNSCGNAAFSPDGDYIIFDAHSDDVLDSGDGKWEIYKMNVTDLSIVRLTMNDKDDWGARWSPDGSKIAFMGGGLSNTGYELYVMNADGSGVKQLTHK